MESLNSASGLPSVFAGDNVTQQPNLFRPWTGKESKSDAHDADAMHEELSDGNLSDAKQPKPPQVVHPVKLFWPKSRCYDYLYQDAQMLLRNYPVQATICFYDDSSSDEDCDEQEEEVEKELN